MEVRPRVAADVARCAAIAADTYAADGYPLFLPDDLEHFVTWPHQELAAWVAVDGTGSVVGHAALHRAHGDPLTPVATAATGLVEDQLGVVARVFTVAEARRAGVAQALLATAVGEAHRRGLLPVLDVGVDLLPAVALYERLGWERIGRMSIDLPNGTFSGWVYRGPPPPAGA